MVRVELAELRRFVAGVVVEEGSGGGQGVF